MKKPIILVSVLLAMVGIVAALYIWNKPKRTAEAEKPAEIVTATQLYSSYTTDEVAANTRFLNKTIQVSGNVESISSDGKGALVINFATESEDGGIVSATFPEPKDLKPESGSPIIIKGICAGYIPGEMLGGEVQLSQCALAQ
jgi:hypothetical protein